MLRYSNEQLATVVAIPIVTSLLVWTVFVFHKNRKRWGPYDIPIVSVLVLSVIRNATVLVYLLATALTDRDAFDLDYCSVVVWLFNSLHTFQASSLTTIAVVGLFSVRLHRKEQSLRQFLTPTHVIYHLFCLTTLCACVGVAAILAQNDRDGAFESLARVFDASPCRFMPFELDVKYNVFIVVLHVFLAAISFFAFLMICFNFYRARRHGFDSLKKSTSDLSEMSLGLTNTLNVNVAENSLNSKGLYDTYVVHKAGDHYYDQNGCCAARDVNWNSDFSNISTTVSSTNSRRPCLGQNLQNRDGCDRKRTGLETIHPVLIVCYLFYHLPLIVLCIYPKLIHPWPVAGIALWLGLVQDILIPIGLGIVDSRFCKWVSGVYRCSGKKIEEKLPHVGLDGKFRPFGSTGQPRSLEITNPQGNGRQFQPVEHRFPITNGSLYTSIDGRLPVIHNYRRNKDQRSGLKTQEKQSSNVALHSSHLSRVEFSDTVQKFPSCGNCEADLCPSHSNLHHLSPHYVNKHLNLHQGPGLLPSRNGAPSRVSQSQESLTYLPTGQDKQCFYRNSDMNLNGGTNHVMKNSRNLVRLNKMRLSRSEDSLNELQREFGNVTRIHVQKSRNPAEDRPKNYRTTVNINVQNGYSSSDDDCLTDTNDPSNANPNDTFDSMSSKSCYSITTEANCDFEFFQSRERLPANLPQVESAGAPNNNEQYYPLSNSSYQSSEIVPKSSLPNDMDKNFRITRSNSKRSLESFRAFIESEDADLRNNNLSNTTTLQRSNSYGTLDDRKNKHSLRHKIKSIEYLPGSNTSTVYIEDLSQYGVYFDDRGKKLIGSAPDLKKVFISEYI